MCYYDIIKSFTACGSLHNKNHMITNKDKIMTLDNSIKFMFVTLLAVAATIMPDMAFAINKSIGDALCALNNAALGSAGKAIATLAVVFVGIGAFFGKASWGLVLLTAVGIGLVFGASAIAGVLGSGKGCV